MPEDPHAGIGGGEGQGHQRGSSRSPRGTITDAPYPDAPGADRRPPAGQTPADLPGQREVLLLAGALVFGQRKARDVALIGVEQTDHTAEARHAEFACVARQFRIFSATESGPRADWLRDLVDWACGDPGSGKAGVVGLCLTGNFALSMAASPRVGAAVMGEPSLPMFRDGLRGTDAELATVKARMAEGLEVRAYRYSTDTLCPASRFAMLEAELGVGFKGETLEVNEKLHSVFIEDLRDSQGRLRHQKVREVIEVFGRLLNS